MKTTSKTVLNKIAKRPPMRETTRAVILYRCRENGAEHQKWIDISNVMKEGDTMTIHFKFDDLEHQDY